MNTLDNILNRDDTLKQIGSIAKRGKALRADVDLTLKSAFVHAAEHGDATLISKLYNAVPLSFRADVKRFVSTYSPLNYDTKSKQFKKAKKGGQFDMLALEIDFDNVPKAEKQEAEYNRKKEVASIVKFLDTKADRAIAAGDTDMIEMILEFANVVGKFG